MGKLGIPSLKVAKDLFKLCETNSKRIEQLRQIVISQPPSVDSLYQIDEISDLSSQTADASQAIHNLFPSNTWKQQASSAQSLMQKTMHTLNSDKRLYDKLIQLKDQQSSLNPVQSVYLQRMILEFQREGTYQGIENPHILTSQKLERIFVGNSEQASVQMGKHTLGVSQLKQILTVNEDSKAREEAYKSLMSLAPENKDILSNLVSQRTLAAKRFGFNNYSEYLLSYQTFKVYPQSLQDLLVSCNDLVMPKVQNEYDLLLDQKALREQEDRHSPVSLHPWDTAFYVNRHLRDLRVQMFPRFNREYFDEQFFTISNVLDGLVSLTFQLFGVQIVVTPASPEAAWSDDILAFTLKKEGESLGTLFLDLFARPGKLINSPAKLNVVCPRRLSKDVFQRPVSVLTCAFRRPEGGLEGIKKSGLHLESVKTLFHEYGHALHSLLGKSEFQAFSGTRVPIDLAELPSHIFEHFLSDYAFVASWAKHTTSKEPYPLELFKYNQAAKSAFKGLNHHIQLFLAEFDIHMHTTGAGDGNRIQCRQLAEGWQNTCTHLGEYGSTYYSYALNQALSEMVWKLVFRQKVDREAGMLLSKSLLEVGGNRTGQEQLSRLLGPSFLPVEGSSVIDPFEVLLSYYVQEFKNVELVNMDQHRENLQK